MREICVSERRRSPRYGDQPGSGFHGGEAVADGKVAIVVDVDADDAVEAAADFGDDFDEARRDRATVGVAQAEHVSACFVSGLQGAESEIRVGDVAVEEVFGVVDHLFAVFLNVTDGFGNEHEVLVLGDAEGPFDV